MPVQLSTFPNSSDKNSVSAGGSVGNVQLSAFPQPKKVVQPTVQPKLSEVKIDFDKLNTKTLANMPINTLTPVEPTIIKTGGVTTPSATGIKPITYEPVKEAGLSTYDPSQIKQESTFDKVYGKIRDFVMSPGGNWQQEKEITDNVTSFEQYYREKNPEAKEASPVNKLLNSVETMSFPERVIATGVIAGTILNPVKTVISVAEFGVLDGAIKFIASKITGKEIQNLSDVLPENYPQYSKDVIDVLSFIGTGFAVRGINKKAPAILDSVTKNVVESYKLPKTMYIEPKMIKDFTTPEQSKIINDLGLTNAEFINAWKNGITIEVPAQKIVTIADKPYWAKIKGMFGLKSSPTVLSVGENGVNKVAPRGLLGPGDTSKVTPTTVGAVPEPMKLIHVEPKIIGDKVPVIPAPKATVQPVISTTPIEKVLRNNVSGETFKILETGSNTTKIENIKTGEVVNLDNKAIETKFTTEEIKTVSQEFEKLPKYEEWIKTNKEAFKMIANSTEKAKSIPNVKDRASFLKDEKEKFDTKFSNEYYKLSQETLKTEAPLKTDGTTIPIEAPEKMPAKEISDESKTFQSRVYDRLKAERPDILKEDVSVDVKNVKEEIAKSTEFVATDKNKAYSIAMGSEPSSEYSRTTTNMVLAEKALEEGNYTLYNTLVKNRSFELTRKGQEISMEQGSITDNSTNRYVKELISTRLSEVGKNYLGDIKEKVKKGSTKERGMKKIKEEVDKAEKTIAKTKEIDLAEAQSIIDKLTCK